MHRFLISGLRREGDRSYDPAKPVAWGDWTAVLRFNRGGVRAGLCGTSVNIKQETEHVCRMWMQ